MSPREFFPAMPDAVFDTWLAPLIAVRGWPFSGIDDDLASNDWRYILGVRTTLDDWFHAPWQFAHIPALNTQLYKLSLHVVKEIITHVETGAPTSTANLQRTKERFWACADYIARHGTIPAPVVLRRTQYGYKILDGNHRIAALLHRFGEQPPPIPAWVTAF